MIESKAIPKMRTDNLAPSPTDKNIKKKQVLMYQVVARINCINELIVHINELIVLMNLLY